MEVIAIICLAFGLIAQIGYLLATNEKGSRVKKAECPDCIPNVKCIKCFNEGTGLSDD